MKKLLIVGIVFSVLVPSLASAHSACQAGDKFNIFTGAPCGQPVHTPCQAGDLFNSQTGKSCLGGDSAPSNATISLQMPSSIKIASLYGQWAGIIPLTGTASAGSDITLSTESHVDVVYSPMGYNSDLNDQNNSVSAIADSSGNFQASITPLTCFKNIQWSGSPWYQWEDIGIQQATGAHSPVSFDLTGGSCTITATDNATGASTTETISFN